MCDKLNEGVRITYQIVLPMVVVLGVVGSAGCIWVLRQPSLRKATVNSYLLLLSCYDLLLCFFYIPIITSACGCIFDNQGSAWYFAHFGWSVACTLHALGTYVIIVLSLDRFVGVWFPTWFKTLQQPPLGFRNRMVAVALVCVAVHVLYMVDAEIKPYNSTSSSCISIDGFQYSYTNCSWISNDGFQKSYDKAWHQVYRYFYNLIVRWLPSVLLLVLNIGLVMAVGLGKVKLPRVKVTEEAAQTGMGTGTMSKKGRRVTRSNERILVATVIAMTASYVLLTLPITIFLTVYADSKIDRCTEASSVETLRHAGNVCQLLEHVLHSLFLLFINPRFRKEVLYLLKCRELSGSEGDTTTPDDPFPSGNRPISGVSRSSSRVRDSKVTQPLSCQPLRSDLL